MLTCFECIKGKFFFFFMFFVGLGIDSDFSNRFDSILQGSIRFTIQFDIDSVRDISVTIA